MKIAVVTGASSGMGKDFVLQLDKDEVFDEIWVIARRKERLEELSPLTRAKIRSLACDLTLSESIENYENLLKDTGAEVAVLVNAGGYGKFTSFEKMEYSDISGMISLNSQVLAQMTYKTLPFMKEGSRIYQLGSLSAFQPVPYIGLYGATKAFVLSLSRALNVELKKRGIRVMAVCPGWVKTEFFNHAVKDDTIVYYNKYFESAEVVERAIRDMKKGKDISVCGFSVRVQVFFTKLLPHKLVMYIWCKQQKKI